MDAYKKYENTLTPERIKAIEDYFDVKFIMPNSLIILHDYTLWRPALSETEALLARKKKVPVFTMSAEMEFVPLLWSANYKF